MISISRMLGSAKQLAFSKKKTMPGRADFSLQVGQQIVGGLPGFNHLARRHGDA